MQWQFIFYIKYLPMERFFHLTPFNFCPWKCQSLKLKSSPEIPDYKIPELAMPSTLLKDCCIIYWHHSFFKNRSGNSAKKPPLRRFFFVTSLNSTTSPWSFFWLFAIFLWIFKAMSGASPKWLRFNQNQPLKNQVSLFKTS